MRVLVCCCVLTVLAVSQVQGRAVDYPNLHSDYADLSLSNRHGVLLNRREWPDYPSSQSAFPAHVKRAYYRSYVDYKRSSLNELIQRLLALRGNSRETGRASMMRFGAGRR